LVDADPQKYPVEELLRWRAVHDEWTARAMEGRATEDDGVIHQGEAFLCGRCLRHRVSIPMQVCPCGAHVIWGATHEEEKSSNFTGGAMGFMAGFVIVVMLPMWINSWFSLHIPASFGLGTLAMIPIGVFVVLGAVLARKELIKQYPSTSPRFFWTRIA
jgi:hypothetical protein